MYRAYARKRAFLDEMMHGIPISSVAPRGSFAGVSSEPSPSRMVSAELLRLSDSRTVDALLDETMLACFSCDIADGVLGFALIVPPAVFSSCSGGSGLPFALEGVGGTEVLAGVPTVDRAIDFRVAVDLVETVERTEAVDAVRFATGPSFGGSMAFPPLIDGVVLEATDGGRFGTRGVLAPVVCTLVVDTDDAADDFRVRPTLLGVSSDLAVSNAVEFSLVVAVESVDAREEPDVLRRVEGPATPLRMVDAVERVDLMDAATDFGRGGGRSVVAVECTEAVLLRTLAVETLFLGIGLGLGESGDLARSASARLARDGEGVVWEGVSLESGRRLLGERGTRRESVVVVTRDAVECVLRATERTEAAEDLTVSRPATDLATLRMECRLTVSESSILEMGPFRTVSLPPRAVDEGVAGINSSCSFTSSNSAPRESAWGKQDIWVETHR